MITNDKQIDLCLEQICKQGCCFVNQAIDQLEQGQTIDSTQHLELTQRKILLQELKHIMAVYAETNSCKL